MTYSRARPTTRPIRIRKLRAAGLLVALVALATSLAYQVLASSSSPVSLPREPDRALRLRAERGHALGEADGALPDGTTVFDGEIRGIAKLSPLLLGALRRAATAAADDRVEFVVDSGWRSSAYQERLLRDAVAEYGSEQKAARWVATPKTSAHVSGNAVDMASGAAAWLSEHGARYGLCQIYRNEPWHYELRTEAIDRGCQPMYADPAHDPKMQQ